MLGMTLVLIGFKPLSAAAVEKGEPVQDTTFQWVETVKSRGEFQRAIEFLDAAEKRAFQDSNTSYLVQVLLEKASIFQIQSENIRALTLLYKAQRITESNEDEVSLASITNQIGSLHHSQKHYEEAERYYRASLKMYLKLGIANDIGKCYNNFGALKQDMGKLDSAIIYHRQSLKIWKEIDYQGWIGISHAHIGNCHMLNGDLDSASMWLRSSIKIMEAEKLGIHQSKVYSLLGNTLRLKGDLKQAIELCQKGLEYANEYDIVNYKKQACKCLYQAYESSGLFEKSMSYYKAYISYRDSVSNDMKAQEITRLEMDYSFGKQQLADSLSRAQLKLEEDLIHQAELSKEREERNIALFSVIAILVLSVGLWSRLRYMRRSRKVIESERNRSDELLLNILPASIAAELKSTGGAEAQRFEGISILFTDFKGFTQISEKLSPEDLVREIDTCFRELDLICEKFQIEKIKTIGDSYMAAGGLPIPFAESAKNTVLAAIEMNAFILDRKVKLELLNKPAFEMRLGIHTGTVVAGIVGHKKFQYDVWGDTVNAASRMESSGKPGRVNISKDTFELIRDETCFVFEERGRVSVKGKGEMEMFFVDLARVCK